MRVQLVVALLGLGMMLGVLGGCGGGNEFPNTFNVTGTVVTDGAPVASASVILLQNGKPLKQTLTGANGSYNFPNVPTLQTGTYSLEVLAGANNVQSIVGPFNVTSAQNIIITAPSLTDLAGLVPSVKPPTNGTATLVVFANNTSNNQLQQFTVTVGALSAASTPGAPAFATVTGITVPSSTVVVTDTTNNLTATLNNVSFTGNTITYLQAVIPGGI